MAILAFEQFQPRLQNMQNSLKTLQEMKLLWESLDLAGRIDPHNCKLLITAAEDAVNSEVSAFIHVKQAAAEEMRGRLQRSEHLSYPEDTQPLV